MEGLAVLLLCSFMLSNLSVSIAEGTLNTTQLIRDGETIVSVGGKFELGFFSPGSSTHRYLGIWYRNIPVQTVVWVANREVPLKDLSGVLKLTDQGILVLLNFYRSTVWSSNSSRPARSPVAQLLNSGNLIVKEKNENNPESYLWQSFDYPCDTFLQGMKLGRNLITGLDRYLSSWKSPNDPSNGNFTYRYEVGGFPEFVLREGSVVRFRPGPWNGLRFSGTPELKPNSLFTFGVVFNEKEVYFSYKLRNDSILSRLVLTQDGFWQRKNWIERTQAWEVYVTVQMDICDNYALCGAYGSCNKSNSPECSCLKGFEPKLPEKWDTKIWLNGCVRKTPLNCSSDEFIKYSGVKLPDSRQSWFNYSMNLEECKNICKRNCSCTAYANLDIRRGGSGCLLWFVDLVDIREFTENGQEIYIRVAASELDQTESFKSNEKGKMRTAVISMVPIAALILGLALILYLWRKARVKKPGLLASVPESSSNGKTHKEDLELPLFDLATISCATNNFSTTNKLGEGGFGPVYKGIMKDGQEIAVKRLSKSSRQGLDEFKNEVIHIAKLQHRNLVKLLGCCIQGDEKMLIYEFMPNKSLDFFIFGMPFSSMGNVVQLLSLSAFAFQRFYIKTSMSNEMALICAKNSTDQSKSMSLDWHMRYHVINGIARGLLYLHQDSRQRIIHRDLKASNVLLDNEMNPKISDFGLARSFGEKETAANTKKVVGTYGYMAPEYAIDGLYSIKSDVFSFGVLVLEIVSGKRNRGFCHPDHQLNLLGHAWRLYSVGDSFELIASPIKETCNLSEVLRSIDVGLLCVQQSPKDRPSMCNVVQMLGSQGPLPQPKQPGFFTERDLVEFSSPSTKHKLFSSNDFTITQLEAR
ncbi:Serine/threonine kinases,protein kinases,ATP binding,sugar binding,kinases,carbohydrate binding, putative [Theobroma cacao]|uniref:Receptor-like serine/threonine-protein kinase n=1 Tax=Theobroma cacao TaxID=3641 RepID=A0A061F772_THECC|nr:Serine/threonine kinases,protein kinases,ATP binding,sugar binding,kinases,carbohydrate binding, putative [Theobroma cacao]